MITYQRIASQTSLDALEDLIQTIWPEVFTPIIGEEQVAYMLATYQSRETISAEIASGVAYFLIGLEGQNIGYCAYETQERQLFISKIYLLNRLRGQGISRQVFEWLANIAKSQNLEKLQLHVNRYNQQAVAVYQHFGFVIVKEVDTPLGEYLLTDYWMEKQVD